MAPAKKSSNHGGRATVGDVYPLTISGTWHKLCILSLVHTLWREDAARSGRDIVTHLKIMRKETSGRIQSQPQERHHKVCMSAPGRPLCSPDRLLQPYTAWLVAVLTAMSNGDHFAGTSFPVMRYMFLLGEQRGKPIYFIQAQHHHHGGDQHKESSCQID